MAKVDIPRQRQSRTFFVLGIYALGSLYGLFALVTFISTDISENIGRHTDAYLFASYAAACVVMAGRAKRIRSTSSILWSRATESTREAVAGGILIVLAFATEIYAKSIGEDIFGDLLQTAVPFLGVSVWLLIGGSGLVYYRDAQGTSVGFSSDTAPGQTQIAPPWMFFVGVGLLIAFDAFAFWLWLSTHIYEAMFAYVTLERSPYMVATAGALIVFGVLVSASTWSIRRASADSFQRASSILRQFVILNCIFVFAVVLTLLLPTQPLLFSPFLTSATPILIGVLALTFFGSFRTQIVEARADISAANGAHQS